jgi:hypothetical protein
VIIRCPTPAAFNARRRALKTRLNNRGDSLSPCFLPRERNTEAEVVYICAPTRWKIFFLCIHIEKIKNFFHPVIAHIGPRVEGRVSTTSNNTKGRTQEKIFILGH